MGSLGVSLYSSQQKETYKHEKLLELYGSGDMESARSYLARHIGYFINQTRRQVSDDLYLWTAAEAIKVIDENIVKQLDKKTFSLMLAYGYNIKNIDQYRKYLALSSEEEQYYSINCYRSCLIEAPIHINPIKLGRYLIWRLWGHLMNLHREGIRKAPIENMHTDDIPTHLIDEIDTDMIELHLENISMTEDEAEVTRSWILGMGEKNILDSMGITRPTYRKIQKKIKKKLADYYYSQGILHETSAIPT